MEECLESNSQHQVILHSFPSVSLYHIFIALDSCATMEKHVHLICHKEEEVSSGYPFLFNSYKTVNPEQETEVKN